MAIAIMLLESHILRRRSHFCWHLS